ncbi:MAG: hypothetical protein JW929_08065 [Anaerolineales bacterium]|nr:hypothetical protein [Anaerolineales bacterium]
MNWSLFTLALWVPALLEERELVGHFGGAYRDYQGSVPCLFPNWAPPRRPERKEER